MFTAAIEEPYPDLGIRTTANTSVLHCGSTWNPVWKSVYFSSLAVMECLLPVSLMVFFYIGVFKNFLRQIRLLTLFECVFLDSVKNNCSSSQLAYGEIVHLVNNLLLEFYKLFFVGGGGSLLSRCVYVCVYVGEGVDCLHGYVCFSDSVIISNNDELLCFFGLLHTPLMIGPHIHQFKFTKIYLELVWKVLSKKCLFRRATP